MRLSKMNLCPIPLKSDTWCCSHFFPGFNNLHHKFVQPQSGMSVQRLVAHVSGCIMAGCKTIQGF